MFALLSRLRQTSSVRILRSLIPNQLANSVYHLPLAVLANFYFRFPSHQLKVIGVTGTDGKTTTTNLIYHLLKTLGKEVAMVSTVNAAIGKKFYDTGFHVTSPHPWVVQRFLQEAVREGAEFFVMEVTSHALDQYRVWGIPFKVGVYTNIAGDHLGYHGSMKNYLSAKAKLAQQAEVTVLNAADPNSQSLSAKVPVPSGRLIRYGIDLDRVDIFASKLELGIKSTKFRLKVSDQDWPINLPLGGKFNVENFLAAVGAVKALGLPIGEAVSKIGSFESVLGRMELVEQGQPFSVIVDFAHTPNALKSTLEFLRQVQGERKDHLFGGRIIVIFGCAGERDPGRRRMGKIAAELANIMVITAEDPRTEGVEKISQEIAEWAKKGRAVEISPEEFRAGNYQLKANQSAYFLVPDRQEAINLAIETARKGDIVLITGKGHEKSMCFGTQEVSWSDQQAVKQALEK